MKNIALLLLACACAVGCTGQSASKEIEKAKMKMFRETVEFLAKDSATFKKVVKKKCGCESMDSLKGFVAMNGLTRVDEVIETLDKKHNDTSAGWMNVLPLLKRDINDSFFTSDQKQHRQNIQGFKDYQARMEQIIQSVQLPDPPAPKPAKQKPIKPVGPQEAGFPLYPYLLYAAIALLAAICILLFFQKSKLKEQLQSEVNKTLAFRDELAARKHTEQMHRSTIASLEEDLKTALQEKTTAERSLEKLSAASIKHVSTEAPQAVEQTTATAKKYAKYADAGNGFSESYFVDQPDNETIFEITFLSADLATYVVSSDQNVQRYALANADYFLRRACQYDSLPTTESVINTREAGQLRKQGSKWVIESPAKLSF